MKDWFWVKISFGIFVAAILYGVTYAIFEYQRQPYAEECSKMSQLDVKLKIFEHEKTISNLVYRIEKLEKKL